MPTYHVTHSSSYHLDEPISEVSLLACLTPLKSKRQELHYHSVVCSPLAYKTEKFLYSYGNIKVRIAFKKTLQRVEISAISKVEITPSTEREEGLNYPSLDTWRELFPADELRDVLAVARSFAGDLFTNKQAVKADIEKLMAKIQYEFTYDTQATTINTHLLELFNQKKGVCQDFSRVAIAILNACNIKACYVSGYLFYGKNSISRQPASHAWVSAFIEGLGWLDFDPTNNQWANDRYVKLAIGRDYLDVVPLAGELSSHRKQELNVAVTIEKLN